jgi:hypothetical protein
MQAIFPRFMRQACLNQCNTSKDLLEPQSRWMLSDEARIVQIMRDWPVKSTDGETSSSVGRGGSREEILSLGANS